MPFHFPFFRDKLVQRKKAKEIEEAKKRSERIRQAPTYEPQKNKRSAAPSSIVGQFQNLQKRNPRLNQSRVTNTTRKPNERRDEFFHSLTSMNPLERFGDHVDIKKLNDEDRQKLYQHRELSKIKVIAFVGSSGTGKSTKAIQVTGSKNIRYFIDDGLLIEGGRIVGGSSAKKASTKIESVRQAIFYDDSRAANMRRTLLEHKPDRLMILGTSDNMIEKICANLWLKPPLETVRIEDVSSAEERRIAKTTRMTQGSHTIPVPSMEIKHEFSGYFQDPLSILRKRRDKAYLPGLESERTVVRPTFSGMGSYSITDEALASLVRILLEPIEGIADVMQVKVENQVYGAVLIVELSLFYGYTAPDIMKIVQEVLLEQIENHTSINILSVHVTCRKVVESKKNHRKYRPMHPTSAANFANSV